MKREERIEKVRDAFRDWYNRQLAYEDLAAALVDALAPEPAPLPVLYGDGNVAMVGDVVANSFGDNVVVEVHPAGDETPSRNTHKPWVRYARAEYGGWDFAESLQLIRRAAPEPAPVDPACGDAIQRPEPEKYNYTGRLLRCVDADNSDHLTVGKVYREVVGDDAEMDSPDADDGLANGYYPTRFEEVKDAAAQAAAEREEHVAMILAEDKSPHELAEEIADLCVSLRRVESAGHDRAYDLSVALAAARCAAGPWIEGPPLEPKDGDEIIAYVQRRHDRVHLAMDYHHGHWWGCASACGPSYIIWHARINPPPAKEGTP